MLYDKIGLAYCHDEVSHGLHLGEFVPMSSEGCSQELRDVDVGAEPGLGVGIESRVRLDRIEGALWGSLKRANCT